ncbi:MAG: L-threonylcarbamoyladenylate synthase [Proteobacteria bacterium]|nr:L-threonylcarbamoyladenylate synthase [Pseudomonadota bacterium]
MMTIVLDPHNLEPAVAELRGGGIVAIPTETVYGLASNAFDDQAVTKIFQAKDRPLFDPLIVHVPLSWNSLSLLDDHGLVDGSLLHPNARHLADRLIKLFWPGPLTLVLPKKKTVPDLVTSGLPHVAVRMPSHSVAQNLLRLCKFPLAAPSANRFGRISPTTSQHVMEELDGRVAYIIEGGPCQLGVESTVLFVTDGEIKILRPGSICQSDIQNAFSAKELPSLQVKAGEGVLDKHAPAMAPGMLAQHYAPRKPLHLIRHELLSFDLDKLAQKLGPLSGAIIAMDSTSSNNFIRDATKHFNIVTHCCLSESGDSIEAARNLFSLLRLMDESPSHIILAEIPASDSELWLAIKDRLQRASTKI